MIDKALLAKIRKCMALSSSANEHEAALALAKARALMEEHGVTEAMLDLADIEERSARASRNIRPSRWETILAATICHALSVTNFVNARGDRTFIGRGPRAEIASYAFAVLFRKLKSARADYIKSQLRRCKPGRKRARADMFSEGWAEAVYSTILRLIPAPAEDEGISTYLAEVHPGLMTIDSRKAKPARAANDYVRGALKGMKVDLNVGLGAAAAPLAIA